MVMFCSTTKVEGQSGIGREREEKNKVAEGARRQRRPRKSEEGEEAPGLARWVPWEYPSLPRQQASVEAEVKAQRRAWEGRG